MDFVSSGNSVTENNLSGSLCVQLGGDETVYRNYWADYLTKYPNATEIDSSGVGNTPYVFYSHGLAGGVLQDNNPLMEPISIPNFGAPSSSPPKSSSPLPSIPEFPSRTILLVVTTIIVTSGLLFYHKRKGKAV